VSSHPIKLPPSPEVRNPSGSELPTSLEAVVDETQQTSLDPSISKTSPVVKALWAPSRQDPDATGRTVLDSIALPAWRQYEDLRLLGEGGMGRIFRAVDPALKRPVALKFLRREAPDLVARFVQEAQHQAMVDHPNVCKVYEVGEWQGQTFIAMQFIDGQTLEAAREDMSLRQKVEVMEAVAEAIHMAHRQGLIHRDLKPANIMVERTENLGWKPFVLDFGLARGMHSAAITEHGFVFGTAHYMAPEQVRGESDRVGRRTDVYALGATLYKLLTGEPPFPGKDALDCMRRTAHDEPRPVRKLAPEVPADLETIVMKCLEKAPDQRYDSTRALAEELRRFREGEPILSHPPSLLYRLRKKARKHKTLFAVSIAAMLTVLVFAGLGLQARWTASSRAQWAQHFGQRAEQIEALIRYAHLLPRHDIRPEVAQVRELMAAMAQDAERSGSVARGPAAYALGRGHLALEEPAKAKECLEKAWGLGFRAPEVSYALGRTYGALYQQELERARRISEPDLREAKLKELERQYRDASLFHLRAGGNATLEPLSYRDALLAFYDQNYDEALQKTREACRSRAWFYEALRLEGEILLAQANARTQPQEIDQLLQAAIQRFEHAQSIAPSDAALLLGEARCWRQSLDQGWWRGEFSPKALEAGLAACDRARSVDSGAPDAYALEAWLQVALIRYQSSQGQEIEVAVREARTLTEKALEANPQHLEALVAKVSVESRWARQLWFTGRDPQQAWREGFQAGQQALQIDPMDISLLNDLSRAHLQSMAYRARKGLPYREDWEIAATLMEQAVKAMPGNHRLLETLGFTYIEWAEQESVMGREPKDALQKSKEQLRKAIAVNPGSAKAHYLLACAHLIQGGIELGKGNDPGPLLVRAIESELEALRLKPDYSEALMDLAQCYLLRGRWNLMNARSPVEQVASARAALLKSGGIGRNMDFFGELRLAECGMLEAEWLFKDLGEQAPAIHVLLAEAEGKIRSSLRKNLDRDGWLLLAKLSELRTRLPQTKQGLEIAKGLEAAQKAIHVDDQFAESWYYLGLLHARQVEASRSLAEKQKATQATRMAFERAISLNPRFKVQAFQILNRFES
jgi:predicted Ser/Thr protein kinase